MAIVSGLLHESRTSMKYFTPEIWAGWKRVSELMFWRDLKLPQLTNSFIPG